MLKTKTVYRKLNTLNIFVNLKKESEGVGTGNMYCESTTRLTGLHSPTTDTATVNDKSTQSSSYSAPPNMMFYMEAQFPTNPRNNAEKEIQAQYEFEFDDAYYDLDNFDDLTYATEADQRLNYEDLSFLTHSISSPINIVRTRSDPHPYFKHKVGKLPQADAATQQLNFEYELKSTVRSLKSQKLKSLSPASPVEASSSLPADVVLTSLCTPLSAAAPLASPHQQDDEVLIFEFSLEHSKSPRMS